MASEPEKSNGRGTPARSRLPWLRPKPNRPGMSAIPCWLCTGKGTKESSGWRTSHLHRIDGMIVVRIMRVFQIYPESEICTHTASGRRRSRMFADIVMITLARIARLNRFKGRNVCWTEKYGGAQGIINPTERSELSISQIYCVQLPCS